MPQEATLTETQQQIDRERTLVKDITALAKDPRGWVHYSFPWGKEGELQDYEGPDTWQEEVLTHITARLQDQDLSLSEVIRIAIAAGNGPGKSALISWIILWAMSTREDTRGVVTANTDIQLRTKTWAELAKWYQLCIVKHWFHLTATAIYSKNKAHERTWRIDQVPWSEEKTEAFSGLHNKGKRIILIFDEASAIPDKIWEISEGALTDKDTEIIWIVSGNPTRNTGRFRECWGKLRHRWRTWQIDIRESILVNQAEVLKWIEDYGIDSDWVLVHVRGLFPKASALQFIPSDIVAAARGRQIEAHKYHFAPKIISVDNAWTGGDEIVIGIRQGLVYRQLQTFQKNDDDNVIAGCVAKHEDAEKADGVFIDLGYGTGVYSAGKAMNRKSWMLVAFGGKSNTAGFGNKRAEMWGMTKKWLEEGGCIPDDQKICDDLTGPESHPNLKGEILIEKKEVMRKRGLASPNRADALCLTFAFPVAKKQEHQEKQFANNDYDPLAEK